MLIVVALVALVAAGTYWLLQISELSYLGQKAVTALYNWGASRYDKVKEVRPQDDALHLARPLLTSLHSVPVPLVLDVATGTARLPMTLLRQWDFQGYVVGVDISPRMLALAQRKTATQNERVGLVHADAMNLPFADHTFHAVTGLEALELLPDGARALAEMVRVLCPGGQLVVTNRTGLDALLLPGRVPRPQALEQKLYALGLTRLKTRRWQKHYDLVEATKPSPVDTPHT